MGSSASYFACMEEVGKAKRMEEKATKEKNKRERGQEQARQRNTQILPIWYRSELNKSPSAKRKENGEPEHLPACIRHLNRSRCPVGHNYPTPPPSPFFYHAYTTWLGGERSGRVECAG